MKRQFLFTIYVVLVFIVTLGTGAQPARAAMPLANPAPAIVVTTLDDELNADGDCSLREAITAANTNVAVDACASGVPGADTITFGVTGTITLGSSLPPIDDMLTIDGPGAASLTISGNNAWAVGAVFKVNAGQKFNVRKVTIANGCCADAGGGISNLGGTLIVSDTIIANNQGEVGGGIYNSPDGSVELIDSTLSGNVANESGGGIFNMGLFTVTRSSLIGNRLGPTWLIGMRGGGIENSYEGTLYVIDSTLSGNIADNGSGSAYGGGINNLGAATILNSTLSGNYAIFGGGIWSYSEEGTTIIQSTLYDNRTRVGNWGNSLGGYLPAVRLYNSIVATTAAGFSCSVIGAGYGVVDGGHNLQFPDSSCGGTIPVADPQPGPLQANGGSTFTHALLEGSPAIDTIPLTACGFTTTDQRGVARPQGSACDIGAFEVIQNQQPSVDAGGPYSVNEGTSVTITASGSDPENGTLSYAWDLDDDGIFEAAGQSATFSAAALDGPSSYTINVQVTDEGGFTATDQATVVVLNVAPTADFMSTPGTLLQGQSATLAFSNPFDPAAADTAAGFRYSYDCTNDGTFELASAADGSYACAYPNAGTFEALGRIADKDGDFTDYTIQVRVLTPREGTEGLIDQVQALIPGTLNDGQGNALIAKLLAEIEQLDRGNVSTAIHQLESFVNQVSAMMSSGVLTSAEGQALLDAADAIIAALGG